MDHLAHWRECLRTEQPAATDEPHCGWWRRRLYKGGPHVPVVIFLRDGEMACYQWRREVPVHRAWFPWLRAITEDAFKAAQLAGHFPDDLPTGDPTNPFTTELKLARPVLPPKG